LKQTYQQGAASFLAEAPGPAGPGQAEEVLIADARAGLTPSDMVERKLLYLLRGVPVAGSHVWRRAQVRTWG
jgi:hypothetical protein